MEICLQPARSKRPHLCLVRPRHPPSLSLSSALQLWELVLELAKWIFPGLFGILLISFYGLTF